MLVLSAGIDLWLAKGQDWNPGLLKNNFSEVFDFFQFLLSYPYDGMAYVLLWPPGHMEWEGRLRPSNCECEGIATPLRKHYGLFQSTKHCWATENNKLTISTKTTLRVQQRTEPSRSNCQLPTMSTICLTIAKHCLVIFICRERKSDKWPPRIIINCASQGQVQT